MNQIENKIMTYKSLLSITLVEMINAEFFKISKNFLDPISMVHQLIKNNDVDQFYTLAQASGNPLTKVIQQTDINHIHLAGRQWRIGDMDADIDISAEPIIQAYSLFKHANVTEHVTPWALMAQHPNARTPWDPSQQNANGAMPYMPPYCVRPSQFIAWLIANDSHWPGSNKSRRLYADD